MRRKIEAGDRAENFTLKDQNGKEFSLTDHKGKRILLSFHPLAWTSICAQQMQSLETNKESFDSLNTTAVGISVDSIPSKKAWADSLNIENTRLLSDFWPHGKVAELYGIFRSRDGISERANIIIDEKRKITFFKVYPIRELPDIQEIPNNLKNSVR
jgi:peroxiredoxin